jgi:hypothetical protein
MTASALELVGMLAACGTAAAALLLRDRRHRVWAMGAALVIAPVLVAGDVWDEPRVIDFRTSAVQVALAAALASAIVAALAWGFTRWPQALPIAAIAVLPLRVPLEIGGETANLLVPLYAVIAAGVIASALSRRAEPSPAQDRWSQRLRWVLAATLVLYAIQASYSVDVSNAIESIGFFLVPFAVLFCLLAEVEWSRELLRRTLVAVGIVTVACAAVGIAQYFVRELFLNPELGDANELHVYFRVNSIFFDPNIFGRYLALALTAFAACVVWGNDRRELAGAVGVFAIGLLALSFSYSLTSFAALLAGLGVVAVLRWSWRGVAAFAGLGAVALAALVIAGGTPTSDIEDVRSIDSGHTDLARGGLILFGVIPPDPPPADQDVGRPIAGYGSGSFGRAFFDHIEQARTTVSHSEPVTVAAEQGVIGLIVCAALLVTSLVTLFGAGVERSLARSAVAACFVALLVASFGYTGFSIDPAMWALLGLGVALRRDPPAAPARPARGQTP